MRFPTRAVLAAILAAAPGIPVEARLHKIGIPETVKPGDTFNATVQQLAGTPLQYSMLFGIDRYDEESSVAPRPAPRESGSRATLRQTVGDGGSSENTTIPGLGVPEDHPHGPAAVQAVVLAVAGPLNSPLLETWWWSVNVTDATSERLVWASYSDDNSRVCQVPFA